MSTRAIMKAEIASDLERTDTDTWAEEAITAAVKRWQSERFYFNESRLLTFVTVSTQSAYTTSDDSDIPAFIELDYVKVIEGSDVYTLDRLDPEVMEDLLGNSPSSGRPDAYSYFEETFRLHPVPDGVYTIRPVGLVRKAAPASDVETGNVWMTEAYDLIKAEAMERIAKNKLRDDQLVSISKDAKNEALGELYRTSSKKTATGQIVPTQF